MNAYELAENLITPSSVHGAFCYEAAYMLRQQADRIAELEKVIQLNNEVLKPMLIDCIKRNLSVSDANLFFAEYDSVRGTKERITPQTKPLSDEEIMEIANNLQESSQPYNINFARAIEERHGIK